MDKNLFGKDFKWGVSTAAFQIEGSCSADGKGPSVWDTFTATKGKIQGGQHAGIACDFYNRYERDLDLVRSLNIPNFRFSIAWSRILPEGKGLVNQKGIDFYNRIIDACLERGIDPWPTLYHWDLPQALENLGGWTNRDIVEWFSAYTDICARNFGDRIGHWMVMNEPMVFTGAGHFLGVHAPGRTGLKNFFPAVHHAVLSMAAGGRILKESQPHAEIGTTFSCSHIEPYSRRPWDVSAANRADVLFNRLLIEPVLGMGYPDKEVSVLKGIRKYMQPGDEDKMSFDFDFIGIQTYTREIVRYSLLTPYLHAELVKAEKRKVPLTSMKWEVYPQGIYPIIKKYSGYKKINKIYITENGAAFTDILKDGAVDDQERLSFIRTSLQEVLRARNEGCPVEGYFVWTLTDNFEWAEGYHPRFGLVHVDFVSQERTVKSSGEWYRDFLK